VGSEDGLDQPEVPVEMGRGEVGGRIGRGDPVDDREEIVGKSLLGLDEIEEEVEMRRSLRWWWW
jgi:hypothetical protein